MTRRRRALAGTPEAAQRCRREGCGHSRLWHGRSGACAASRGVAVAGPDGRTVGRLQVCKCEQFTEPEGDG